MICRPFADDSAACRLTMGGQHVLTLTVPRGGDGTTPEEAHITASTNYFTVVCFHSVVVFVPMFIAWAWMLSRWRFSPLKVLLRNLSEAG